MIKHSLFKKKKTVCLNFSNLSIVNFPPLWEKDTSPKHSKISLVTFQKKKKKVGRQGQDYGSLSY